VRVVRQRTKRLNHYGDRCRRFALWIPISVLVTVSVGTLIRFGISGVPQPRPLAVSARTEVHMTRATGPSRKFYSLQIHLRLTGRLTQCASITSRISALRNKRPNGRVLLVGTVAGARKLSKQLPLLSQPGRLRTALAVVSTTVVDKENGAQVMQRYKMK
jgi:hypothetical protein